MTSLTSTWLVYKPYYEANKDTTGILVTTRYGTSKDTTMSYGVYKIDSLQSEKQMVFVQNENWYGFEKQSDGSLVSYTNFEVDGKKVQQYQTTKIQRPAVSGGRNLYDELILQYGARGVEDHGRFERE